MPSIRGPYTVEDVTGTGVDFSVVDASNQPVVEFKNNKPYAIRYTQADATATAAALNNDDTQYNALVRAHYLGGNVSVSEYDKQELYAIIVALELLAVSSDPAVALLIARLNALL